MNKNKGWVQYLPLIIFALFIWGFFVVDMVLPTREFSQMENRYLTQAPTPTVRSVVNNDYTQKYEEYVNDQFALRDTWITIKSVSESLLGKQENNGVVYGKDGYLFDKQLSYTDRQVEKSLGHLATFREKHPQENIRVALVPNSYAVLRDKLPAGLHNVDQLAEINQLYLRLEAAGIATADLAPVLEAHRDEYIYYRTDHHWTTYGAWLAYTALAQGWGVEPVDYYSLEANEVEGFYGTYYSKTKLFSAKPDTITWFDVQAAGVTIDTEPADGIYNPEMWTQRDKYAAFLRGNNGLTVIESGCNRDSQEGEVSRILLLKDSYGNSLAPFLLYHFDEVVVVDLRYFSAVDELIQQEGPFQEILFLYNFDTFSTDVNLTKLIA